MSKDKDFKLDVLNDILDDLYENDYARLNLPLGILVYDDILGHPILNMSLSIYKAVKDEINYLTLSEMPEPITRDKHFIPIPSFYLINGSDLHTQVYMLSNNNKWYKVNINGTYSIRKSGK